LQIKAKEIHLVLKAQINALFASQDLPLEVGPENPTLRLSTMNCGRCKRTLRRHPKKGAAGHDYG
jgi:hypothetical protein